MRAVFGCLIVSAAMSAGLPASAQDVCSNIRLSVSEQIDCRARTTNALGDADRTRVQQEFESRVRRANDQLITPPTLSSPEPGRIVTVPSTSVPAVPGAPTTPTTPSLPDSTPPGSALPGTPPTGSVTRPGGLAPGGSAIAPDMTAPNPTATPLPPISPLPSNPAGSLGPS